MKQVSEQLNRLILHRDDQLYAVQSKDGKAYYPKKEETLSKKVLEQHLAGEQTISAQLLQKRTNYVKAVCIDYDRNYADEPLQQVYRRALDVKEALEAKGLQGYIEFSGQKGFHLWIFFAEPLPGSTAREVILKACQAIGYKPKELFPAGDYIDEDGSGPGYKQIKLPCGIHQATNKRTGFLREPLEWTEDGYPVVPENQADIMAGFEQVPIDVVRTLREMEVRGTTAKLDGNMRSVDFSGIGADEHPQCILYYMECGAPLDQEYNSVNLTIARYAIAKGLNDEAAREIAGIVAEHTSPDHPTSKKSVAEKLKNFESVMKTVCRNPNDYPWSCGYVLESAVIKKNGACAGVNCPYWLKGNGPQLTAQANEADFLAEQEFLAYLLTMSTEAAPIVVQEDIDAAYLRGKVVVEGKSVAIHSILFAAIQQLIDKGHEIRPSLILSELTTTYDQPTVTMASKYLAELQKTALCIEETFILHLRRIKDIGARLALQSRLSEASATLNSLATPVASVMDSIGGDIRQWQKKTAFEVLPVIDHIPDFVDELFGKPAASIPTASMHLDRALNGGWQAEKLYVIGAPPGCGKTTFCTYCADYAAERKHPVIYVAFEMSLQQLIISALARIGGFDSSLAEAKRWNDDKYPDAESLKRRVGEAIKTYTAKIGPYVNIIEAGTEVTVAQLNGIIARVRNRADLPEDTPVLVVIDYLQLMMSGDDKLDSGNNETTRVSRIATALKQLARDTDTAVIAISDITKQAYQDALKSGSLDMGALRDSFKIAHAADVIMLLQTGKITVGKEGEQKDQIDIVAERCSGEKAIELARIRDRYPLDEKAKATYARLSLLKNRGGMTAEPLFVYEKAYHRFTPIDIDTGEADIAEHQWVEDGAPLG